MEVLGKAAGSRQLLILCEFLEWREEHRDGGRETVIPLFECPGFPFMILLQKRACGHDLRRLIWMVDGE